jgi:hypothetical protein
MGFSGSSDEEIGLCRKMGSLVNEMCEDGFSFHPY